MEEILERLFEKFNQEKKLLEEIPLTERWADGKPKLFPEEITNIIKKYDNAHDQIYLFSMRIIYELRPDFKILKLSLIASFTRYTEKFLDKLMSDRHGVSLEQSANLDNFKSRLGTVDYDYLLGLTKSSEEKIFYYENCVSRFASICREITTLLCQLERFEDIKEFAELSVRNQRRYKLSFVIQ